MSSIRLKHASGNSMSLAAPGTNPASNLELKLPHTIGSANQLLKVDGSGQLGWATDNSGVSLSGSTNNTIATVTGANALTGEASLTFDAGLLKIDDLSGTAGKGRLEFGNSGEQYIEGFDTGNGGSGSYLAIGSNTDERLRITADGDVGIGCNNPGADPAIGNDATVLEIRQTTSGNITSGNNRKGAVLRLKHEAQWENGYQSNSPNDDLGRVEFVTGDNSAGEGVRAAIRCRNLQYFNSHDLTFETFSSSSLNEKLRLTSAGDLGLGTNDPDRQLHIRGSAPIIRLDDTGGGYSEISANTAVLSLRADQGNTESSSYMNFQVDGTERLRIHSDGKVSLGTSSSASAKFNISHGNELALYTSGPYNYQAKFESTDAEAAIVIEDSNSTSNANRIGVITNDMTFITNNSENLRIKSNGSINFSNTTIATKNTAGDITIDFGNLTDNGGNAWRKCGVWIMYNGIDTDATDNKSVIYYTGVGSATTWNWVGDTDTLSNDSFNSVTLQNAAATSFRLYCDVNNQNTGSVTVLIHAWNTKPTITIN